MIRNGVIILDQVDPDLEKDRRIAARILAAALLKAFLKVDKELEAILTDNDDDGCTLISLFDKENDENNKFGFVEVYTAKRKSDDNKKVNK